MKHIFLNLKRFDVPVSYGGVNRIAPMQEWGSFIVKNTQDALKKYDPREVEFVQYLPEAHLLNAVAARCENSPVQIGCQSVYRMNTAVGGNFGAFTTNRPVSAMKACGVNATIIGHCEERNDKVGILAEAGVADTKAVNRILNREIRLDGVDKTKVVIGYEPIWSIGPGKTPAGKEYITKIARFVKEVTGGIDVVYGGGLKVDNAEMLASIDEIDGGLIALTRFQGEIGFYPDEYLEIIRTYLGK